MTEGAVSVDGTTGQMDGGGFAEFLDNQHTEFGEPDVGEEVFEGMEEDSDSEEGEESEEIEEEEVSEEAESRRSGTDEVIARLEELDETGEAAELVKGMQRKMNQNINEWNTLRSEVLDMRSEMLAMKNGSSEGEDDTPAEPTLAEGITEENVQVFKDIAQFLGYTPPDEQAAMEASKAADEYSVDEMKAGVEEFGSDFGTLNDDGTVTVNPEIQQLLKNKFDQLRDPSKGITARDLFRLVKPGAGQEQPAPKGKRRGAKRTSRGNTVRRTTSGRGNTRVRSEKGNDDPSDVFDRCFVKAKTRLTQP